MEKLKDVTKIGLEPVTIKYRAGLLVDPKFSALLGSIFSHKTTDSHQRCDLKNVMKKFTAAHKAFQAEYSEISQKYAELDEKGKPIFENNQLKVSEDKMEDFNKECDGLFNREDEMVFENGRKPFNSLTLQGINLSAADANFLDDFYSDNV